MEYGLLYFQSLPENGIRQVWLPHISRPVPEFASIDDLAKAPVKLHDLSLSGNNVYVIKVLVSGSLHLARYGMLNGTPVLLRTRQI